MRNIIYYANILDIICTFSPHIIILFQTKRYLTHPNLIVEVHIHFSLSLFLSVDRKLLAHQKQDTGELQMTVLG